MSAARTDKSAGLQLRHIRKFVHSHLLLYCPLHLAMEGQHPFEGSSELTPPSSPDPHQGLLAMSPLPPSSPPAPTTPTLVPLTATRFEGGYPVYGEDGEDGGIAVSSPIRDPSDAKRKRKRKKDEEKAEIAAASAAMNARLAEERQNHVNIIINQAVKLLEDNNITFAETIHHVSDPQRSTPEWRQKNLWSKPHIVNKIFSLWTSSKHARVGRRIISGCVEHFMVKKVAREAQKLSKSGVLRITGRAIDSSFISGWNFGGMEKLVEKYCPTIMSVMRSIVTTRRQEKEASQGSLDHKGFVSTSS